MTFTPDNCAHNYESGLSPRCPNYGPRPKPGPTDDFIQPADVFDFSKLLKVRRTIEILSISRAIKTKLINKFPTRLEVRVIADLKQEFQNRLPDLGINSKSQ